MVDPLELAEQAVWDAAWALHDPDPSGQRWRRSKAMKDAIDYLVAEVRSEMHKPREKLLSDRVLLELKRMALTDIADGLERYVVDNGADHDDDCPCDDTCECSRKPINDAANSACRLIRAMAESGSGTLKAKYEK
jgi:hypothetical protein